MRDKARRRFVIAAVGIICSLGLGGASACARGASADERLPVPTFAESSAGATTGPGAKKTGLPDDCAELLSVDDLGALFALPIGSVSLRTVRGVPAPSVGRTERVTCSYTRSDANAAAVLDVNIGRYTDEAAAAEHWSVNSAAESGGGPGTAIAIGDAKAMLVERPAQATLLVVYRLDTLTFVLPARAAGSRPAQDVLVDLAKRLIPVVAATLPPPSTTPPPPPPDPAGTGRPEAGALGSPP